MTSDVARRTDRNVGMIVDRRMPDDRYIVASFVVLMDDAGAFSAYVSRPRGVEQTPMPSDAMLLDLTSVIAQAWALANLTTNTEGTA